MASVIYLQLNQKERELYEIIEINSRVVNEDKNIETIKGNIDKKLAELKITEYPEWLTSVLADMEARFDELFDDRYASIGFYFSQARRAFQRNTLFPQPASPALAGLIKKGFNPELPHMQWAKTIVNRLPAMKEQHPTVTHDFEFINYLCDAEHLDIEFKQYQILQFKFVDDDWVAGMDSEDYMEWYAESRTSLTQDSDEFKALIKRLDESLLPNTTSLQDSDIEAIHAFDIFHPQLKRKAFELYVEYKQK